MKNVPALLLFLLILLACHGNTTKVTEENPDSTKAITPVEEISTTAVESPETAKLPATQKQEKGKLFPVDEGQLSPDFDRFRQELLAAVDRRDVRLIEQAVDENIKVGFGDENGRAAFMQVWELDKNPGQSKFWQEFKRVLQLGGVFDRGDSDGFMAPYPSCTWPEDYEPFDYVAVVGENVRLRTGPASDAQVTGSTSYDIVKLLPPAGEWEYEVLQNEEWVWQKVQLADGQEGYVYGKYLCGPVDYRAYFERKGGRWSLLSFLAGD